MVQQRIDEIIREIGRGQARPAAAPTGASRPGRRAPMDSGLVALGISAMAFYWLAPAVMSGQKRRRRRGRSAQPPSPPPA